MVTPHQRNLVTTISFILICIALIVHTVKGFMADYTTIEIEPAHVSGDLVVSAHVTEGVLMDVTFISPSKEVVQPSCIASGDFVEYRITNAEPGVWKMKYLKQQRLTFSYYVY